MAQQQNKHFGEGPTQPTPVSPPLAAGNGARVGALPEPPPPSRRDGDDVLSNSSEGGMSGSGSHPPSPRTSSRGPTRSTRGTHDDRGPAAFSADDLFSDDPPADALVQKPPALQKRKSRLKRAAAAQRFSVVEPSPKAGLLPEEVTLPDHLRFDFSVPDAAAVARDPNRLRIPDPKEPGQEGGSSHVEALEQLTVAARSELAFSLVSTIQLRCSSVNTELNAAIDKDKAAEEAAAAAERLSAQKLLLNESKRTAQRNLISLVLAACRRRQLLLDAEAAAAREAEGMRAAAVSQRRLYSLAPDDTHPPNFDEEDDGSRGVAAASPRRHLGYLSPDADRSYCRQLAPVVSFTGTDSEELSRMKASTAALKPFVARVVVDPAIQQYTTDDLVRRMLVQLDDASPQGTTGKRSAALQTTVLGEELSRAYSSQTIAFI